MRGWGRGPKNLVIDIRDVHDKVNVVTEVVRHYTPKDVLGHIIPGNG